MSSTATTIHEPPPKAVSGKSALTRAYEEAIRVQENVCREYEAFVSRRAEACTRQQNAEIMAERLAGRLAEEKSCKEVLLTRQNTLRTIVEKSMYGRDLHKLATADQASAELEALALQLKESDRSLFQYLGRIRNMRDAAESWARCVRELDPELAQSAARLAAATADAEELAGIVERECTRMKGA